MLTQATPRKSSPGDRSGAFNLRPILDVVKRINSERNLRRLVTMILDTTIKFSNATRGSLAIFKGDSFNAELSRHRELGEIRTTDIPALAPVLRQVAESGKSLVIPDVSRDDKFRPAAIEPGRHGLSIVCLPLRCKSRLVGAVYLDNTEEADAFGDRQLEFAEILVDHAAIAIENALLYRQSTQDRVTNVYNHAAFEQFLDEEIGRARLGNFSCGLLMIDVDDFKQINDEHGHQVGNDVLRNVAYSLQACVRGADIVARVGGKAQNPVVARYGGDEFEVILPGATREGALATAKRIVTLFNGQKFMAGDRRLKLSLSIGVGVFPDDAPEAAELILRADEALYQCKRAGKGRAALCKPKADPNLTTRSIPKKTATVRRTTS